MRQFLKQIISGILPQLARRIPKEKGLILFGAFNGRAFGDNSASLFKFFLKHPRPGQRYVWLTDSRSVLDQVRSLGGECYLKHSLKGIWLGLRASLVVTSSSITDVLPFIPFSGCPKELALHHGIPLRHSLIRPDPHGRPGSVHFSKKRFRSVSCLISTSDWATEQLLKNIPVGKDCVRVTGLPRLDCLFASNGEVDLKRSLGLKGKCLLYAPTWRKWDGVEFFPFPDFDGEKLVKFLSENHATIILRPHHTDLRREQVNARLKHLEALGKCFRVLTLEEIPDVEVLLKIADVLITDYSSIYFDYLLLDKPCVFVPYDFETYVSQVGEFNCDYYSETPGLKVKTQMEFIAVLRKVFHSGDDGFAEARRVMKNKVHAFQDGGSCSRVAQAVDEMVNGRCLQSRPFPA